MSLKELFKHTFAFSRGHFQLSNGSWSDTYVDCRKLTLDNEGLHAVTTGMLHIMMDNGIFPKYIGGPASAAIPIVAGLICPYRAEGFYVRKEAKEHGTKSILEGHIGSMSNCIIVDDVATSGQSLQHVVDVVQGFGSEILGILVVVDREEGARKRFEEQNIPFHSLITLEELKK